MDYLPVVVHTESELLLLVQWLWFVRISARSSRLIPGSLTDTIEVVANYAILVCCINSGWCVIEN